MAGLATVDSITNPDRRFTDAGIHLLIASVTHGNTDKKTIFLSNGQEIRYDKLLVATGASPLIPDIEKIDLEGVFTLRTATDAVRIKRFLEERKAKKLIFLGSGFTNLEVATLLCSAKPDYYDVTVIEMLGHPLPLMLDADLATEVQGYLTEKGFNMRMAQEVVRILGRNGVVSSVELATGEQIEADMVLLSIGVKQNLDLANDLGLEVTPFGTKVNGFLETSVPDVMAAGDCVEKYHSITKKPVLGQFRGPAVIQGRLAAKRLAGYDIEFPGVLNNSAVKLFDKYIAAVGFTEEMAREEGFEPISTTVNSRSKHGMIPGVRPWTLKLTFDKGNHRLLGGQIISDSEGPVKEIDAINALILGEKRVSDLTTVMFAGNPDCSSEPSLEPVTICAEQALQKLKK